ncbi:hypothetical protein BHE74_00022718, partial [Ensete ventricosum]
LRLWRASPIVVSASTVAADVVQLLQQHRGVLQRRVRRPTFRHHVHVGEEDCHTFDCGSSSSVRDDDTGHLAPTCPQLLPFDINRLSPANDDFPAVALHL